MSMGKVVCMILGHGPFIEQPQTFLPRRKCDCCGEEQIQLPQVGTLTPGKWVSVERHKRKYRNKEL